MQQAEHFFWIGFVGAALALGFAGIQIGRVLKSPKGDEETQKIADSIRRGSNTYLLWQYPVAAVLVGLLFAALYGLSYIRILEDRFVPFSFLSGALCSALAGLIGMKTASAANARAVAAAREGLNPGLNVAFASGSVTGFAVVGLGLLEVTGWFFALKYSFGCGPGQIVRTMLAFGLGASLASLLFRVGGGIYAKAASLSSDLVWGMSSSIPDDDPRNPVAIADNVGDSVSDVHGMGADLYETYVDALLAALFLGWAAWNGESLGWNAMLLPITVTSIGVLASLLGSLLVRADDYTEPRSLPKLLRRAMYCAALLTAALAAPITYIMMGSWSPYLSLVIGLAAGCLFCFSSEYFTLGSHHPVRELSAIEDQGLAGLVMGGVSLGLRSTVGPLLILGVTVAAAFLTSGGSLHAGDAAGLAKGLYGVALAGVGMLSSTGVVLSANAYGPVAKTAMGISRLSGMDDEVCTRTDALEELSRLTSALGKGFAQGAGGLTSLSLLLCYVALLRSKVPDLDLAAISPAVLLGGFVGVLLTFLFASLALSGVQRITHALVTEVHRQFKRVRGVRSGKTDPDYVKCVSLCIKNALWELSWPACLAVVLPLLTGFALGPQGAVGLLVGVLLTAFTLGAFLACTGGAWANRRPLAAGRSDPSGGSSTLGDPFRAATAPALNVLIKLCVMVSIAFVNFTLLYNLAALAG